MFDIAGTELLLIIILAIIFVGPKDLPRLIRGLGAFVRKARLVMSDFQRSFEDLANQADLEDIRRETGDLKREAENFVHRPIEPAQETPSEDDDKSRKKKGEGKAKA